jgi:hypothetical protein
MIVYNVTINIDADVHEQWVKWMLAEHIPEVLATGLFMDARMSRMLIEEEGNGITYSIQYTLDSMEKMKIYEEQHAPRLRADVQSRYDGKFAAFRTMMEVIGQLKA